MEGGESGGGGASRARWRGANGFFFRARPRALPKPHLQEARQQQRRVNDQAHRAQHQGGRVGQGGSQRGGRGRGGPAGGALTAHAVGEARQGRAAAFFLSSRPLCAPARQSKAWAGGEGQGRARRASRQGRRARGTHSLPSVDAAARRRARFFIVLAPPLSLSPFLIKQCCPPSPAAPPGTWAGARQCPHPTRTPGERAPPPPLLVSTRPSSRSPRPRQLRSPPPGPPWPP